DHGRRRRPRAQRHRQEGNGSAPLHAERLAGTRKFSPQELNMENQTNLHPLLGRLSWDAIPYHEPILLATFAMVVLGGLAVMGAMTKYRLWGPLWRDWVTSI